MAFFDQNKYIKIDCLQKIIPIYAYFMLQYYKYHICGKTAGHKGGNMLTIIIGTLLFGGLFATYEKLMKPRRKQKRSYLQMDNESRVIDLPENLEAEKKRRRIH